MGFGGEVAGFYARYRRGYSGSTVDGLVVAFGLTPDDVVLDLGCGSGQLTVPLAGRVGAVVGVDPEPDMLRYGRERAGRDGVGNVTWVLGSDGDLGAIAGLLGGRRLAAVTIGTAIHLMAAADVFAAVRPMLRDGGGVAVLAHGLPVWLQDSDWSRALKAALEGWLGRPLVSACGTDATSRARYRALLTEADYADVRESRVDDPQETDVDWLVGHLYSALGGSLPAPQDRPAFRAMIERAVAPHAPLIDQVGVTLVAGRR
jgi:SAM-dependent methyltransferase